MTSFLIFLKLLFAVALPTFVGYSLAKILFARDRLPRLFIIAISYGLGFGLLSQWILILGILSIKFTIVSITVPLLAFFIVLLLFHIVHKRSIIDDPDITLNKEKWRIIDYCLFTFIVINLIYIFWRALTIPIYEWDSIATHAFHAKVLFYERSLTLHKNFPHPFYPLHVPFQQMWLALCLGRWDDQLVKLLFPLTASAYLMTQYFFLKKFSNRRIALTGLALLLSANFFTYQAGGAYREVTMMYYNCAAIMFLLLWQKEKKLSWFFVAAFFSGMTSFVKQEGQSYIFIHLILLGIMLRQLPSLKFIDRTKLFMQFSGIALFIASIYFFYKNLILKPQRLFTKAADFNYNNFDMNYFPTHITSEELHRLILVPRWFLENLFLSGNWNIIWFLFVISLLTLTRNKLTPELKILLTGIILFFILNFAGYVVFIWIDNLTTLSRCLLHFFPLVILSIIFILNPRPVK